MNKTATFAAGCFWGVEDCFRKIPGVLDIRVGYTGGTKKNPTYEEVCTDTTGHAEAVNITFDPEQVSFKDLLTTFWKVHDPTQVDRQGPDIGRQYRSAIFVHDEDQRKIAEASKDEVQAGISEPIATQIVDAGPFYEAEEYHQRYFEKRGGSACHI
ncbi:peptide-methionine (S)-S-oxide reductase MsrA [Candidatus Uhrbacteria bacterium]|nr:peptide-methionine (S)-S-oxide reductase MsrA [Candidatus Uhrbacteria bacterium]MBD3283966.1 peptide-methionine (S)-S-oxide reductase MsrA [Candidatus Uhrbacteria bacterium]